MGKVTTTNACGAMSRIKVSNDGFYRALHASCIAYTGRPREAWFPRFFRNPRCLIAAARPGAKTPIAISTNRRAHSNAELALAAIARQSEYNRLS